MMRKAVALVFSLLALASTAVAAEPPVSVTVDGKTGTYSITDAKSGWTLSGKVREPIDSVHRRQGHDRTGEYRDIWFDWKSDMLARCTIRTYFDRRAVLFRLHYQKSVKGPGIVFPNFTTVPPRLHPFSFREQTFAPPSFSLAKNCTPWLLFDDHARSLVVSPASNFMVATMSGDGAHSIGCGLNKDLGQVPKGLDHETLVVFGDGIGSTWETWGKTLRAQYRRSEKLCDSDLIVTKFGYWTDNGADYYYNYDLDKGYAATLEALLARYRVEGIPVGYLQLDSWWYDKTIDDADGKPGGAFKNARLPAGMWNRYGGLWEYRADKELFHDGLAAFDSRVGMPLAVHNRWMDRKSPYHERYQISGVAATDPAWWNDVAGYLASSGVTCYEQDWLDHIYQYSPEMARTVGVGDAFTDGMARACARHGMTIQYCMPLPRFFLQGLKYPNLTTIRTSGDRFEPGKWSDFLFVSQLADAVGIRPWSDVFMSPETGNMILSVLSAGPVGTGDRIGKEDKASILRAALPDGVLVKPDRPALPSDRSYVDRSAPVLASTYTEHNKLKTLYLFGFPRGKAERGLNFSLSEFGVSGKFYVYEPASRSGQFVDSSDVIRHEIDKSGFCFLEAAPVSSSGISLLGDLGKIVATGKQRIADISDRPEGMGVRVSFARGETAIVLSGQSPRKPVVSATRGMAALTNYDLATGRFSVTVSPTSGSTSASCTIKRSS